MQGQSLIEFAFLAPVMMLLILGMIDLGRGFYFQTQVTDGARDGARLLVGWASPSTSVGPGFTAVCNEIERDLSGLTFASTPCVQMSGPPSSNSAYPFYTAGTDYTAPPANQAEALVYCGTSADCVNPGGGSEGSPGGPQATCDSDNSLNTTHTCVIVEVVYTFSFLTIGIQNIAGPSITIQDAAHMATLW